VTQIPVLRNTLRIEAQPKVYITTYIEDAIHINNRALIQLNTYIFYVQSVSDVRRDIITYEVLV
jgi:hypothetical protein